MALLRQFPHYFRQFARTHGKKAAMETAYKSATNNMENPMLEETLRYVDPFARINIRTDVSVKVRSSDVHQYPNGDALITQLKGIVGKNAAATMNVNVSENRQLVDIDIKNLDSNDFQCELQVPLRADLHIDSKESANVSDIYSDNITVLAHKNINVESLKARVIKLCSEEGNITSKGLLLGKSSTILTKNDGDIKLDKLQGDELHCHTDAGNIHVGSCYVELSKFETNRGNMILSNVHKRTEVHVHDEGNVTMNGVHGNLYMRSNGGSFNLQLSELKEDNIIVCDNIKDSRIYISEDIEAKTYMELFCSPIVLDESLSHLSNCLSADKTNLEVGEGRDNQSQLLVTVNGSVKLGKLSWADNLMAKLSINDQK